MSNPALHALCQLHHIETQYWNIWGQHCQVPESTQKKLLSLMGYTPATLDNPTMTTVEQARQRDWQKPLPPIQVIQDKQPINLFFHDQYRHQTWCWSIEQENGTTQQGTLVPEQLPVLDRHGNSQRYGFDLPVALPLGYHRFHLAIDENTAPATMTLIVAPGRTWQPDDMARGKRHWGLALQIYSLRSTRNWGIGDFTDLYQAVEKAAALGAKLLGLSPLHVLYDHHPEQASPYSPCSRLHLNPLFIDVQAVEEFRNCSEARETVNTTEFQQRLADLRHAETVRYDGVWSAKREILWLLYRYFRDHHQKTPRGLAFREFQKQGGRLLQRLALFQTLKGHFRQQFDEDRSWRQWPEDFQNPDSDTLSLFADQHRETIDFHQFLQWQASEQLAQVTRLAKSRSLGLYQDLAVSAHQDSAEVWGQQNLFAWTTSVGAPPDDFSLQGQNWGLPPMIPDRLQQLSYQPFIDLLRANMKSAGALRIDHVMGLMRLFWIPENQPNRDGAYVHYPLDDLMAIVALESHRHRCLVIGEDLGTVPDSLREKLHKTGLLSYRLLYFEKDHQNHFKAPQHYPDQALTAIGTHDLPTLSGFWQGRDLKVRHQLGLFPSDEEFHRQLHQRYLDRQQLCRQLQSAGRLSPGDHHEMNPEISMAIHRWLADSPCQLQMVQLEDVLEQTEQMNLPGTCEEYPNWRHKLTVNVEIWLEDARIVNLARELNTVRGNTPIDSRYLSEK